MSNNTEILDLQQSKVQIELRLGNAYHTISIFDFCLNRNTPFVGTGSPKDEELSVGRVEGMILLS
jgi:hypothetical protein